MKTAKWIVKQDRNGTYYLTVLSPGGVELLCRGSKLDFKTAQDLAEKLNMEAAE